MTEELPEGLEPAGGGIDGFTLKIELTGTQVASMMACSAEDGFDSFAEWFLTLAARRVAERDRAGEQVDDLLASIEETSHVDILNEERGVTGGIAGEGGGLDELEGVGEATVYPAIGDTVTVQPFELICRVSNVTPDGELMLRTIGLGR